MSSALYLSGRHRTGSGSRGFQRRFKGQRFCLTISLELLNLDLEWNLGVRGCSFSLCPVSERSGRLFNCQRICLTTSLEILNLDLEFCTLGVRKFSFSVLGFKLGFKFGTESTKLLRGLFFLVVSSCAMIPRREVFSVWWHANSLIWISSSAILASAFSFSAFGFR